MRGACTAALGHQSGCVATAAEGAWTRRPSLVKRCACVYTALRGVYVLEWDPGVPTREREEQDAKSAGHATHERGSCMFGQRFYVPVPGCALGGDDDISNGGTKAEEKGTCGSTTDLVGCYASKLLWNRCQCIYDVDLPEPGMFDE